MLLVAGFPTRHRNHGSLRVLPRPVAAAP
jgi:hypothetical protein